MKPSHMPMSVVASTVRPARTHSLGKPELESSTHTWPPKCSRVSKHRL